MLNTREIALLIWGVILLGSMLAAKQVRDSIFNMLNALLKLLMHPIFIVVILYICIMFYIMYINKVFGYELIKDYIVWICFALLPLIGKVVSNYARVNIKELLPSLVRFSIIPLFIINEYTFKLWIELILLPITTAITMTMAVAETDPKNSQVTKVLKYILGYIGIIIAVNAFTLFAVNISDVKQIVFWEKMFIDIIGISLHFPLLYIVQILCFYEQIIIRTNLKSRKDKLLAILLIFKRYSFRKTELGDAIKNFNFRAVKSVEDLANTLE